MDIADNNKREHGALTSKSLRYYWNVEYLKFKIEAVQNNILLVIVNRIPKKNTFMNGFMMAFRSVDSYLKEI